MEPLGWHLMLRPRQERVICPTDQARHAWSQVVQRIGEDKGVYVFNAADSHGHVGAATDRATAGRLAHDLEVALGWALDIDGFAPARMVPIRDLWHAENVLFYVLRQGEHHGVAADPFHDASSLPDLLGLRSTAPWLPQRVRGLVPRVNRARLLDTLGVDDLEPGDDIAFLAPAAAAAGLCDLSRQTPAAVAARTAAARLAFDLGHSTAHIAAALDVTPRAVRRLLARDASPALVRAIALQLGLRTRITAPTAAFLAAPTARYTPFPGPRPPAPGPPGAP